MEDSEAIITQESRQGMFDDIINFSSHQHQRSKLIIFLQHRAARPYLAAMPDPPLFGDETTWVGPRQLMHTCPLNGLDLCTLKPSMLDPLFPTTSSALKYTENS